MKRSEAAREDLRPDLQPYIVVFIGNTNNENPAGRVDIEAK